MNDKSIKKIRLSEYKFPTQSGEFIGVLKHREMLENKPCLLCYFLSENSKKIILPIWENVHSGRYTPLQTEICFINDVSENTKWKCQYTVSKTENGRSATKFISAYMLNSSVENDLFFAQKFFILLIKRAFPRCFAADLCIEKLSVTEKNFFKCRDKNSNFSYKIDKKNDGNWLITREKINDIKEKNIAITVDYITYDVISKEYI